ncbi:MAG TPA: hypothetical protein VJG64_03245 [Candidatus Paceibacterota bacterium]
MSKTAWIGIIAIIIITAGAYWVWSSSQMSPVDQGAASSALPAMGEQGAAPSPSGSGAASDMSAQAGPATGVAMSATVMYDGKMFSPAEVTIAKGGMVTFVDSAGSTMWIASAMHPSHTAYDDTNRQEHCAAGYSGTAPLDQCKQGSTYSFTFDKVGTWGYHDHMNATAFGKVIVQ